MIKAQHSYFANFLLSKYINRILRNDFSHFQFVNEPPSIPQNSSLLITPNHISWWDGFFIHFTAKNFTDKKFHLMMLESSLKKYWFFNKVGAFSINPESPMSIARTFNYTAGILENNRNYVVFYPQGEIEPYDKRPVGLKEGIDYLIKKIPDNTIVLPIGFRIQYYNERKPSILCRFGKGLLSKDLNERKEDFHSEFTENLELLSKAAYEQRFQRNLF